ncbi:MAG: hypothetical protein WCP39_05120 [Chlamydiota bacterium]
MSSSTSSAIQASINKPFTFYFPGSSTPALVNLTAIPIIQMEESLQRPIQSLPLTSEVQMPGQASLTIVAPQEKTVDQQILSHFAPAWSAFGPQDEIEFLKNLNHPEIKSRSLELGKNLCVLERKIIKDLFLLLIHEYMFLDKDGALRYFQQKNYQIFNVETFCEMSLFCKKENRNRFFSLFPSSKDFLNDLYSRNQSELQIKEVFQSFLLTHKVCEDIQDITFNMYPHRPSEEPNVAFFYKKPVLGSYSHVFPMRLTSIPAEIVFLPIETIFAKILRVEAVPVTRGYPDVEASFIGTFPQNSQHAEFLKMQSVKKYNQIMEKIHQDESFWPDPQVVKGASSQGRSSFWSYLDPKTYLKK